MTIVVNPHSEQEEKVLLAFLNSLQYDYQANIDEVSLTSSQQQEVLRRDRDFMQGKTEARSWDEVKKDLERVYR